MEIPPQRLEVASAGGKTREKGPPRDRSKPEKAAASESDLMREGAGDAHG